MQAERARQVVNDRRIRDDLGPDCGRGHHGDAQDRATPPRLEEGPRWPKQRTAASATVAPFIERWRRFSTSFRRRLGRTPSPPLFGIRDEVRAPQDADEDERACQRGDGANRRSGGI
jgi:hypothetical protein